MPTREEFLKHLRETFKIEASEGIAHIISNLIELEKGSSGAPQSEMIEAIYRDAHSLKGAARAVNFPEIETICQALEGVFSELKNKTLALSPNLFDLLHQTVNLLNELLFVTSGTTDEPTSQKVSLLIGELKKAREKTELSEPLQAETKTSSKEEKPIIPLNLIDDPPKKEEPLAGDAASTMSSGPKNGRTIRISVEKLDSLLNQSEEMLALKQSLTHLTAGLSQTIEKVRTLGHETATASSKFRDATRTGLSNETLQATNDYFNWATSIIKTIEADIESLQKRSDNEAYNSGIKVESLLDDVKRIISVPFSHLLDGFPKAARDLSKDKGKKVKVEVTGSEQEIDRRILEELRAPFMHLLRNAIDHGIEKPSVRTEQGKPETGLIKIAVDRLENNRILITFSDDGAGVNFEKVKQRYIKQEKNPGTEQTSIPENTLINYLFKSGFSTSEIITDISGRGLGLSIVQEKTEQLNGSVTVETRAGEGTIFKIEVPLSLVTFRGVIVLAGKHEYVLPTLKISKVLHVEKDTIRTVGNKQTFLHNNKVVPLVHLLHILELQEEETDDNRYTVLLIGDESNQIGFIVSAIMEEEVILAKKFNSQLKRVKNISGATVLGSGRVLPILNVADLLKSAGKEGTFSRNEKVTEKKPHSVLVVEDSITSRMLLKNILETAGYSVATAIDGIDGYTRLKASPTDLVISDVDMPRMNGFDMTAKIRSDKHLAETPVILVTSLSKAEDRERGLEAGANAYIVKSNFDQSNLLEVIDRLLG